MWVDKIHVTRLNDAVMKYQENWLTGVYKILSGKSPTILNYARFMEGV
jgi:hypothetical protein